MINSPVVRGENLRFREEGVKDILKDVFLPWYNAYRFFVQNVQRYEAEEKVKFRAKLVHSTNVMDRWIMSFTHSLVAYVHQEMAGKKIFFIYFYDWKNLLFLAYRLYTVVPRLVKYVDTLTNWYVRMNRKRLKVCQIDFLNNLSPFGGEGRWNIF